MKILITYVLLTIANVILQTICHIGQVKWKKYPAAIISAVAYGFYTVVIVYTMCDLPLFAKVLVVAAINFVGVLSVKFVEEKRRKDRMWRIEVTVKDTEKDDFEFTLQTAKIPYSVVNINNNNNTMFILYCATQIESQTANEIISQFSAKYFISETKYF